MNRLGLWLFILSESFLFSAVISSRYFLQGVARPEEMNQVLGLAITIVLLGSSLKAYRAEVAASLGDTRAFKTNMLATLGLGLLFVLGVRIEWYEAFHYFPPSSGFGTVFFTMTGLHAFHVISGLALLALVLRLGASGRYGPQNSWPAEAVVKYWHFVDLAWVFIYPTLYLV
jgi:cytochrome c oxidase subunit 3